MKVLNILKVLDFSFSFSLLLLLGGDIETNPGPFPSLPSLPSFDKKEDPVSLLQIVVDDQADKIRDSFDFDEIYLRALTKTLRIFI